MKLMHVGDLHLGKSLGDFDLTDDQEYLLNQLVEIVDATLTDEEITNDVMGIFQQTYPSTVKIDYDNSHTRAVRKL